MDNATFHLLKEDIVHRNLYNSVLLILYILIGTLGNVSVIIVYLRDMKNVFTSGRLFIPFLAFSDLITLLYNGGVELNDEISQPLYFSEENEVSCKVNRFIGLFLVIISGVLYFAIAVHRYFLICKPHAKRLTTRQKLVILTITGLFVLGTSVPKYFFVGLAEVRLDVGPNQTAVAYVCGTDEKYEDAIGSNSYLYLLTVNSFIWSSIIAVLYIIVGRQIHQRNKEAISKPYVKDEESVSLSSDSMRNDQIVKNKRPRPKLVKQLTARSITTFITNNRLSWMFILMTVLNILCFTPKLILDIYFNRDRYFFLNQEERICVLLVFFDNFYLFSNVVNPFIYGFFDKEFRNRFKKRFCICLK